MDNFSAGDDALDHQLEGLLYSTDLSASGLSPTGEDAGVGPDLLATLGLDPNDLMGHGDEAPPPIPAPTPAPFGFPSFNAPQQTGLQQPPSPPTMAADITTSDWADLQLIINQHSVHKVEEDEVTGDKTYVVSNLRKFKIEVALVHRETQPPVAANENQLQLRAVLLYENGCVVRQTSPDEPLLLGETEAVVIGGNATFKLQMGPSVLSSKLGKQNFRIRIEPIDGSLRSTYAPQLVILTEPLKSVTKLERKPPVPGAAPPNGYSFAAPAALGSSASLPPLPPPSQPQLAQQLMVAPPTARQTSPPSLPGQRFAPPGAPPPGSLFPPSPPRDEPAAPPTNGNSSSAAAAGAAERELSQESAQRHAIEEVVRQQRAQIAELTGSNQQILQEMARLRAMLAQQNGGAAGGGGRGRQRQG